MFHLDPGRVKVFVRVRPATEDELGKYGPVPYELQSEKNQVNYLVMLELCSISDMRHCACLPLGGLDSWRHFVITPQEEISHKFANWLGKIILSYVWVPVWDHVRDSNISGTYNFVVTDFFQNWFLWISR